MIVVDPGHQYALDVLDGHLAPRGYREHLTFVKRVGDEFPGNAPPAHAGTTSQEVIRALIDRQKYVEDQRPSTFNIAAIYHLRCALLALEHRAAIERGDGVACRALSRIIQPELKPACATCGHLECARHP